MDRRTFLITAGAAIATPGFAQKKESIKLVSSLPRVGSAKGQTDHIVNAIKLAISDFEKDLPFEVKYEDWDDADARSGSWVAELEANNARKAIADKDVTVYLGTYNSGAARISMPILNEAGLVMVSPACTYPGLSKKLKSTDPDEPDRYRPAKIVNFCRVCPTDEHQGPLTARWVVEGLKAKTVYIIDDKEFYGKMIADGFEAGCNDLKLKILGRTGIDPIRPDTTALMKTLTTLKPDAIYFGGTTQSGGPRFAKDLATSGIKCPLIVPDGCYEKAFIDGARADNLNGRCFAVIGGFDPALLAGKPFEKRYREKYRIEPGAYVVYGYEAAAVALEAIRRVRKKDRDAIRKAVLATKDFDKGALGKWSFDADGDTTLQQITVSKVEDGKFKPVKVITLGEK